MARLTAREAAEKWSRRASAASGDYEDGITAVTESPTEKAADASGKMLDAITEAIRSGRWERGLRGVSLEDWKKAVLEKGVPRWAAGIAASVDKMEARYTSLFPFLDKVVTEVNKMPDRTLADSIARVTKYITEMSKYKAS